MSNAKGEKPAWIEWQCEIAKSLGFNPDEISQLMLILKPDELPKVVVYKDMIPVSGQRLMPQGFKINIEKEQSFLGTEGENNGSS